MKYKIGEVYDIDGVKRKVIGMDGQYPVTTTDLTWEPEKPAAKAVEVAQLRAEIRAELEAEYAGKADYTGLISLIPLDKLNKDELMAIAAHIGKETPDPDTPKAEIVAMILGA